MSYRVEITAEENVDAFDHSFGRFEDAKTATFERYGALDLPAGWGFQVVDDIDGRAWDITPWFLAGQKGGPEGEVEKFVSCLKEPYRTEAREGGLKALRYMESEPGVVSLEFETENGSYYIDNQGRMSLGGRGA